MVFAIAPWDQEVWGTGDIQQSVPAVLGIDFHQLDIDVRGVALGFDAVQCGRPEIDEGRSGMVSEAE